MEKIIKYALVMIVFVLVFAACSNNATPSSSVEPPPPSSQSSSSAPQEEREYFMDLSEEDEKLYQTLTQERGLQEWQIHSLTNQGLIFQDIAELSDDGIAKMLAPGASFTGDYMSAEEIGKLIDSGISEEDVDILHNLGYGYASAIALTPEQLDFIFPNTELVENLVSLGYDRNIVQAAGFLSEEGDYETYKELLDEAFAESGLSGLSSDAGVQTTEEPQFKEDEKVAQPNTGTASSSQSAGTSDDPIAKEPQLEEGGNFAPSNRGTASSSQSASKSNDPIAEEPQLNEDEDVGKTPTEEYIGSGQTQAEPFEGTAE